MKEPIYSYLLQQKINQCESVSGGARILSYENRKGINTTSIHSCIRLGPHTVNENEGAVSLWVLSLEDLDSMTHNGNMAISNPNYSVYPLLCDREEQANFDESVFSFSYVNDWYPTLIAKCYQGKRMPDGYFPKLKAVVGVGHFSIHKYKWYNFVLTWNREEHRMKIYANGILLVESDRVHRNMEFEQAGEILYTGNPTFAISDICFYNQELDLGEIKELYQKENIVYPEIQEKLEYMFCGKGQKPFSFVPGADWEKKCDRSLKCEEDLDYFYVQGKPDAARLTEEGILIETTQNLLTTRGMDAPDRDACYLWTKQAFDGNLYLEYEFKSLQADGLSLLMVQASGMQREDFMKDYPLRTNGAMRTVCWEDVRNYDWEYYRFVPDVRHDTSTHVMLKNPWLKPLGYFCCEEQLAINEWHKLQFLQIENHIIGAIDGKIVIDAYDDPFANQGPVLNFGRIAIRCMIRTRLVVRNFKVYNQSQIPGAEFIDL